MEQTNTVRNWSIIGALVVLVGLVAWFYSGGTGTMPSTRRHRGCHADGTRCGCRDRLQATTDLAPADGTAAPATGGTTGGTEPVTRLS